ncbi:DUF1080 domain-containing protein [candidate division KSB1 bacterium]|nr:DUF1080 domain-containing protein [candidate division KSB1 bacterium]RQW04441.1 MAG: DUF1080 domain-containing protein [candidate division KSB1 bacterium]
MKPIYAVVAILVCMSCAPKQQEPEKTVLFNGADLTGWKLVVSADSVDVNDVWSVADGVVRCAGAPNGYMMTETSYANYRLHLEWRWVGEPTNSGVLLHCQSPVESLFWPNCLECQLQAGNAGDFVLIGPGKITVDDSTYVNPDRFTIIRKKHPSNEKPAGEWNVYDIEARGTAVACWVNGLMQNNGVDGALSSGPIALQSEGSAIEFRNIYLFPLE